MASRNENLTKLLEPSVTGLGYEFVGLEYLSQGRHSVLRIYIDSETGINVEDCEKVSRQLSAVLDVEDPIGGQYNLEISSPGLDRPLFTKAHYEHFIGEEVKIKLYEPVAGRRQYTGKIQSVVADDVVLTLSDEDENVQLPFAQIKKANLLPQVFDKTRTER